MGAYSQYADPSYYLVDSLNLDLLGPKDKRKLDSLLKIYHTTKIDSIKLVATAKLTSVQDNDAYIKYNHNLLITVRPYVLGKKKMKVSKRTLHKYYAHALYNTGFVFSEKNMEDSAIKYYKIALPYYIKIKDSISIADVYFALGVSQFRQGQIQSSLKNYLKALTMFEKIHYNTGIGNAYAALGNVYKVMEEFDKDIINYKKAISIHEKEGDFINVANDWNFLGIVYKWKADTANAELAYTKSLNISKNNEYDYGVASAQLNLGIILQDRKKYDEAIINFENSLSLFRLLGSDNGASYALNSLAVVYDKTGKPREALKCAREAHELSVRMGYPESIINSSKVFVELLKKNGNYKEAVELQSLYYRMKDSISGLETQKNALTKQLEFENDKKIMNLKRKQEAEQLIAKKEKEQQKIITISVVICLIIVILFSVFLYTRFRLIARQKKIIELQKHLVEEKNKEITDSITYAKRLQEAILPPLTLFEKHFPESFVLYQPKDIVAGDFYYMQELKDTLVIAAADCTGHGVPGAMVSVVCANAMNQATREFGLTDPGEILTKVRELVIDTFAQSGAEVKDGMDISLVSLTYSKESVERKFSSMKWAGANNPLWLVRNGELSEFNPDKQPVGMHAQPKPFTSHVIDLHKGDMIYMFTDGYADQFGHEKTTGKSLSGAKGKKFKSANFKRLLVSVNEKNMKDQKLIVRHRFEEWKGDLEQIDDVCVIGLRI